MVAESETNSIAFYTHCSISYWEKKQIFLREVAWELINILVFAMNDTIHFLISN